MYILEFKKIYSLRLIDGSILPADEHKGGGGETRGHGWLRMCSWWEDKEEPKRQTHELFSIRGKWREISFPLTGM